MNENYVINGCLERLKTQYHNFIKMELLQKLNKTSVLFILKRLGIYFFGLLLLISLSEIFSSMNDSSSYSWGWEEGGWRYENLKNYVISCGICCFLLTGIIVFLWKNRFFLSFLTMTIFFTLNYYSF
jgi:hypothetical protein